MRLTHAINGCVPARGVSFIIKQTIIIGRTTKYFIVALLKAMYGCTQAHGVSLINKKLLQFKAKLRDVMHLLTQC